MGTHRIRYLAVSCGVLLLVVLSTASTGAAQSPTQESIILLLQAPAYQLIPTADGYTGIEAEGCGINGQPGQPLLPRQLNDLALPPDVDWDSVSLVVRDVRIAAIPGTFRLRTAVLDQSVARPAPDSGPAQEIPIAHIIETGQMRKWRLARVGFWPFQYDLATGQIRVVEQATVELRFARTGEVTDAALLADTALDEVAAERLINYEQALAWYPPAMQAPMATYNYVIITTNAIETNSTKLASFVTHKQSEGYSVLVVTEDDYGGLTGQPPNGREEKVRQWLMNNYVAYGIKYVMLIGNPTPAGTGTTAVPMKMCWPRLGAGSDEESPTDYFFADLTGDWNKDGDAYYGEYTGDWGVAGGVDFMPEVYVGRIPFYGTYADLDGILQKTMDYGNAADIGWRSTILLPMSFSAAGYDGAPLAQQMWDDYLNGAGYSRWRQYQQGTGACSLDSSYASDEELRGGTVVRDRWAANDYGIVCWWGHGSQTSASVGYDGCWDGTLFDNSQTGSLDDGHPSFVYQNSCTNGYPENTSNLQYAILQRGGIATVSASRVSWFNTGVGYGEFDGSTTNSGIGYEYVERIVAGLTASEALYGAKSGMTPETSSRLMNYYDFNLYGDPAIQITSSGTPVTHKKVFLPLILKGHTEGGCAFDSQFNGSAENWYSHSGVWYIGSDYLYTYGLASTSSSASYAADYGDFDYQASMLRYGCDTCANRLIFRGTPEPLTATNHWYNEYTFQYNRQGDYSLYKQVAGGDSIAILGWTYTSAINQGDAWNTLRVVANGTSLSLYINGTYLWSGTDSSLSYGRAGVGMYQTSSSTGDELRVDWARLCSPGAASLAASPPAGEGVTLDGNEDQVFP
jgi:Peptidase family C25